MTTAGRIPKRADSIRDVVAPQRFDDVQLWLELPPNARPVERFFYGNFPERVGGSRAGGGNYPTLDIHISRQGYQRILERLIKDGSRLVKSIMFLEGSDWPQNLVEAYLLQGAETIKTDLF
ncbi:hypothetical protein HYX03_00590 [Candidatus Woesearchaeota archaeon]|nr:hypothetical protein [Candidatus Woesearchaeota archaeon]